MDEMGEPEREIREAITSCGCERIGFCETFGCSNVKALLSEIDRLRDALTDCAVSRTKE